jgi:hypothetical protein
LCSGFQTNAVRPLRAEFRSFELLPEPAKSRI